MKKKILIGFGVVLLLTGLGFLYYYKDRVWLEIQVRETPPKDGVWVHKEMMYPDTRSKIKPITIVKTPYVNGVINGIEYWYDEMGHIWEIAPYENGKIEGVVKVFYSDSEKLVSEIPYTNGKRNGDEITYHRNGSIHEIFPFKNDKIEGLMKSYYESGKISSTVRYKNSKEEGEEKSYYENGNIRDIAHYKNGEFDGELREYYEDGRIRSLATYHNGEGDYSIYEGEKQE